MPYLVDDNDASRQALIELLQGLTPDKVDAELAATVKESIELAWQGQPDASWNSIRDAYCKAFGSEITIAEASVTKTIRPFREVVTDQWFSDYLEYSSVSEAPAQFHFGAVLTLIAGSLRRRPLLDWEARPTYCNLFSLLVGSTGSRKGSAIKTAQSMVQTVLATNVLPNEGTHQGYAEALKHRYTDTGMSDGLIISPEFKVLLSKNEKHKEALVAWLTDWYDCDDVWERALRSVDEPYLLERLCVSVLGASNMRWLRQTPEDAILGGFFPRFLMFVQPEGLKIWGDAFPKFNRKLYEKLQQELEERLANVPDVIRFDAEGQAWMEDWYKGPHRGLRESTGDEQMHAWYDRKQAALMKVAIILQLVNGGRQDVVEVQYLIKAQKITDWCDWSVAYVYNKLGVVGSGELLADIVGVLERRAHHRATDRVVKKNLSHKYLAPMINKGLASLKEIGVVKREHSAEGGAEWVLVD